MENLKSPSPNEEQPIDDDTLTVIFPEIDFDGNVYIEKVEGPRAKLMAQMRPYEESPVLMAALNELQPEVRECVNRHIGLQQSLNVIAQETGMPIEKVKSYIIAGSKHVQKRLGLDDPSNGVLRSV